MADKYIELNGTASPDNKANFLNNYYSNLKVIFVERLNTRLADVNTAILTKIDADFNLSATVDPEIKQRWFPIGINKGYDPVTEPAHTFVTSQGRLKYLTPIYRELQDVGKRDTAVTWFTECKDFYHPLAISSLKKLLNITTIAGEVPLANNFIQ